MSKIFPVNWAKGVKGCNSCVWMKRPKLYCSLRVGSQSTSGSWFYKTGSNSSSPLSRERSGRIKTMKFSEGCKSFEMYTNCSSETATPAHILECLGLTQQDLADDPLLALDFLKVYDAMDLV
ncbi:RNase H domain-containing protein [Trichonephila clavipes]|nr:RNase H domain-containing protein [Trichonephila clavipes]